MAILLLIVSKIREMSRDSSHIFFNGDFVVDCKLKSAFLECLVKKIP